MPPRPSPSGCRPAGGSQTICEVYDPVLPAPSVSARFTAWPENTVAVAWFTVSVSDPAAPVAVEVADPDVAGSVALTASSAVSPSAAFTHVFCRISGAEVRVLVNVQVTAAGMAGTW